MHIDLYSTRRVFSGTRKREPLHSQISQTITTQIVTTPTKQQRPLRGKTLHINNTEVELATYRESDTKI